MLFHPATSNRSQMHRLLLSLLPLLSAHRALQSPLSSPTTNPLSSHLTYFLLLSTFLTLESLFYGLVLSWIPFYAYIRFFTLLYISTIGAQRVYDEYLSVYLDRYGGQLETYMEKLRVEQVFGILRGMMAWVREQVLGVKPHSAAAPTAPPGMAAAAGYAQSIFSHLPAFGGGGTTQQRQQRSPVAAVGDVYSMLSGFMSSSPGTARQVPMEDSTPTLPGHFTASTPAERLEYISSQRSRLQAMLQRLDKEAENLSKDEEQYRERGVHRDVERRVQQRENISRSRSAGDFEKVEKDEVDAVNGAGKKDGGKGSWGSGWLWGAAGGKAAKEKDE